MLSQVLRNGIIVRDALYHKRYGIGEAVQSFTAKPVLYKWAPGQPLNKTIWLPRRPVYLGSGGAHTLVSPSPPPPHNIYNPSFFPINLASWLFPSPSHEIMIWGSDDGMPRLPRRSNGVVSANGLTHPNSRCRYLHYKK